jgi:antitoxin (DNA-binding transcriptional repressor) of toxin-antitoxin stability system
MRLTTEIGSTALPDLIKQVQAGNEVLLTQDNKPVAKLLPVLEHAAVPSSPFRLRTLKGHRVLTPNISQSEIADDLFQR